MKKAFLILSIYTVFSSNLSHAQVDLLDGINWTVAPFLTVPGYKVTYTSKFHSRDLYIKPNTKSLLGLNLGYKNLFTVGGSFRLKQDAKETEEKGASHYMDFRIHIPYKNFLFRFDYQRYTGMFIENSGDFGSSSYIHLPGFVVRNIGINAFYIVSPDKFSLNAALLNSEVQVKSGGSILHGFYYTETVYDNQNTPFIPSAGSSDFGTDASIYYAKFRALLLSIGYGYTYVFKKSYFITGAGWLGIGGSNQHYLTQDKKISNNRPAYRGDLVISLGYNEKNFFSTLSTSSNLNSYSTNEGEFSSELTSVYFNIGTRF